MKLIVYRRHRVVHIGDEATTTKSQWYWHLKACNGKIVATGGEGYNRRGDALRMARKAVRFASYVVMDGAEIVQAERVI